MYINKTWKKAVWLYAGWLFSVFFFRKEFQKRLFYGKILNRSEKELYAKEFASNEEGVSYKQNKQKNQKQKKQKEKKSKILRRSMRMKTYDVTALGELLIDFTENGLSEQGNPILEANPGGAPCNVLAMLNKLGKKTAFIGKVGNDNFGHLLADEVKKSGTDVTNLIFDDAVHTTLAFVHTKPDGDRDFSFYRNPGADMMLRKEEVMEELIKNSRIFHFGTLSSTHEGVREATRHAIDVAKNNGVLVSFDPNLREPLWDSLECAKQEIAYGLSKCDILKISDNEVEFMTGTDDYEKGAAILRETYKIPLMFVTLGKEGSFAYSKDVAASAKPFLQEGTIETTGAGDTFEACALHYVLEHGLDAWTKEQLEELLTFANAGASIITTRRGALRVMPTADEIRRLIAQRK